MAERWISARELGTYGHKEAFLLRVDAIYMVDSRVRTAQDVTDLTVHTLGGMSVTARAGELRAALGIERESVAEALGTPTEFGEMVILADVACKLGLFKAKDVTLLADEIKSSGGLVIEIAGAKLTPASNVERFFAMRAEQARAEVDMRMAALGIEREES